MHFPLLKKQNRSQVNKIGFAALASAAIMQLLKKQRDAVGLSIYSDQYDFYAPEKGSERHHHLLLHQLDQLLHSTPAKATNTSTYLDQIAEKLNRRSLVFLFTDLFQNHHNAQELFEALRHLKYNKHEVVLFHTYDKATEFDFDYTNTPKRFFDVETQAQINLYPERIQDNYQKAITAYFDTLQRRCLSYKIKYVQADIQRGFEQILTTFLIERQKFL